MVTEDQQLSAIFEMMFSEVMRSVMTTMSLLMLIMKIMTCCCHRMAMSSTCGLCNII